MAMKMTSGHDLKLMWRGESVARCDTEKCTGCGACAGLCPFDAIELDGVSEASRSLGHRARLATVRVERCWGCGICRSGCVTGALELLDRRDVPAVATLW